MVDPTKIEVVQGWTNFRDSQLYRFGRILSIFCLGFFLHSSSVNNLTRRICHFIGPMTVKRASKSSKYY